MIRPKLRPTLSRRVKYLGIAPHAQVKLEREARRGSHDLRKLVDLEGHANFLDALIDTLDPVDDLASPDATTTTSSQKDNPGANDEDDAFGSDEWSDSSDDEDHTLSRTVSASKDAKIARQEMRAAIEQADGDYFGLRQHGHPKPRDPDETGSGEKKTVEVSVTAISPSSDVSDESPEVEDLASPSHVAAAALT